jgi:hypothetical protein
MRALSGILTRNARMAAFSVLPFGEAPCFDGWRGSVPPIAARCAERRLKAPVAAKVAPGGRQQVNGVWR